MNTYLKNQKTALASELGSRVDHESNMQGWEPIRWDPLKLEYKTKTGRTCEAIPETMSPHRYKSPHNNYTGMLLQVPVPHTYLPLPSIMGTRNRSLSRSLYTAHLCLHAGRVLILLQRIWAATHNIQIVKFGSQHRGKLRIGIHLNIVEQVLKLYAI